MAARLLSDEHIPSSLQAELRALGHDVTSIRQECINKWGDGIDDYAVLRHAFQNQRIVVTQNIKHFKALHELKYPHYGVIGVRPFDLADAKKQAKKIDDLLKSKRNLKNQLEIAESPGNEQKQATQKKSARKRII